MKKNSELFASLPVVVKKGDRFQYPEDFEAFWNAYPRRVLKGNAYKAYVKALAMGITSEEILLAVAAYVREITKHETAQQFIAHPTSWLNGARWEDDYSNAAPDRSAPKSKVEIAAELIRDIQVSNRYRQ